MKNEYDMQQMRPAIMGLKDVPYSSVTKKENPFKVIQSITYDKDQFDFTALGWLSKG